MDYQDINSKTIDRWVKEGWEWGTPISEVEFQNASFNSRIVLTPTKIVPVSWYEPFIKDGLLKAKVLGLASGGAQQMPLLTKLGANCTVLDNSNEQLESEIKFAKRFNYEIEVVKHDMTKKLPFDDNTFDIIFHPVSNCYVEDVYFVFSECYRVLKKGGILLAGFDNGINYLFNDDLKVVNKLPYNPLKDPKLLEEAMKYDYGIQFSHTIEEQIGFQLKVGFRLTDLYEDNDKLGIGNYIPNYLATRSIKD